MAATTVGKYAIFAGGWSYVTSNVFYSTVEVYDIALTKTIQTDLSSARFELAAATIGEYALFVGGAINSTYTPTDAVDAYQAPLD